MGSHRTQNWAARVVPDVPGGIPLTVSRVSLAVFAVAFAVVGRIGVTIPLRVQAGIYLLGMVAMNLPHGGYEHFDNLRRRAARFQVRYVALYLAAIGLFAGLLFVAPVVGLGLALSVAMAKGGFGDLGAMGALYGTDHIRSRPQRWLAAAVRGGAVMVVPMVFWPGTFYTFSSIMVNIFEPGALAGVAGAFETGRLVLGVGFATLLAVHLGLGYRRSTGRGSFRADAVETLLLVAYFAAVPVVIAVGLYFPLWYSTRQVARANAVDEEADVGGSGLLEFLEADDSTRVTLGAWGILVAGSVVTFGLAALLWIFAPQPLGGVGLLPGLVAFWSIFVSIIALPHVVVGSWLDRERGIWYVP